MSVYIDNYIDGCQYGFMRKTLDVVALNGIEDCCPNLLAAPLSADDASTLAAIFKVLGDPARVRLLSLIAAGPGAEACVCELTEPLGLSQPTISHHLKVLHESGLLERERRGNWIYYRLRPEALQTVRRALVEAA
jgi:ArsR family transcriptional regulator, arsenate/arsenite/antimonite-responsive transcriptional repressor